MAGLHHAHGQVGILSVGARKSFIKTADGHQDISAVRQVRGDPECVGQPMGAALVIAGTPCRRRRHLDLALRSCGALSFGRTNIPFQQRFPVFSRNHVIVEE
jgi:hypothetical protein